MILLRCLIQAFECVEKDQRQFYRYIADLCPIYNVP